MLHVTRNPVAAAHLVAVQLDELLAQVAAPVLLLPTGSTPQPLYALLRARFAAGTLHMAHCQTFNLDEYWPCRADSPLSFRHFMENELFQHSDLPPAAIAFLDGTVSTDEIASHCLAYEQAMVAAGGVDWCLLGIGVNGHIAFNEPGTAANSVTRLVQLAASTRQRPAFPQGNDAPKAGITVGIQTIMNSKKIIVMACGEEKAESVRRALEEPVSTHTPASLLRAHSNVIWVLDEAAATALQNGGRTLS